MARGRCRPRWPRTPPEYARRASRTIGAGDAPCRGAASRPPVDIDGRLLSVDSRSPASKPRTRADGIHRSLGRDDIAGSRPRGLAARQGRARRRARSAGQWHRGPWQNTASGAKGSFAALAPPFLDHDRICRTFTAVVAPKAQPEHRIAGSACRESDGAWVLRDVKDSGTS